VNWLTRQEQLVLCSVLGLLLIGVAVKMYRAAGIRPATVAIAPVTETNAPVAPK
jgi:hypothetical protein